MDVYFYFALVVAAIGLAVAGRYLYMAWSDVHIGRDRRKHGDRRQRTMVVPVERRKRGHRDRRYFENQSPLTVR